MKVRKRNHLKYFASKDDLLAKLLQPILAEIKNNFFSYIDQQSDLTTLVRFIVTDRINFIENNFDFPGNLNW